MTELSRKVNNFDVLKRMSIENKDIRLANTSNIIRMDYTKAGTKITIGVEGNVIFRISNGELNACLLLFDAKQFDETKQAMENEP